MHFLYINPLSANDEISRSLPWKWRRWQKCRNWGISRGMWAIWIRASCSTLDAAGSTEFSIFSAMYWSFSEIKLGTAKREELQSVVYVSLSFLFHLLSLFWFYISFWLYLFLVASSKHDRHPSGDSRKGESVRGVCSKSDRDCSEGVEKVGGCSRWWNEGCRLYQKVWSWKCHIR